MRRRIVWFCVAVLFAGTAEASHVKVEVLKGKGRHAKPVGSTYTVKNNEKYPVDVCLSDKLSGPAKIELSPFTLERFDHGTWSKQPGAETSIHFTYELRPGWVESYPISVLGPGRYRVVLTYGRAVSDDKSCNGLLHGLTWTARSRAFDVQ